MAAAAALPSSAAVPMAAAHGFDARKRRVLLELAVNAHDPEATTTNTNNNKTSSSNDGTKDEDEDVRSFVPDKSPKGYLDAPIVEMCEEINTHSDFYTTSSCSGRVRHFLRTMMLSSVARVLVLVLLLLRCFVVVVLFVFVQCSCFSSVLLNLGLRSVVTSVDQEGPACSRSPQDAAKEESGST